jgi:ankyrin repeat protein
MYSISHVVNWLMTYDKMLEYIKNNDNDNKNKNNYDNNDNKNKNNYDDNDDNDYNDDNDDDYDSLLFHAVNLGHINVIKTLLDNGSVISSEGELAIKLACRNGDLNMVKYLFEKGADITVFKNEPVCIAIDNDHPHIVKFLIENGANDKRIVNWAIENKYFDIVKLSLLNPKSKYD